MDRGLTRLAAAAVVIAGILVTGASAGSNEVARFAPAGDATGVTQVRVEFADDVAAFGALDVLPTPIETDCRLAGDGRWTTQRSWVLDLEEPVAPGIDCRVRIVLPEGAFGRDLEGQTEYRIQSGGPRLNRIYPWSGSEIEEDQAFVLTLATAADVGSVERNAYLRVEGIASRVDLEVLDPGLARRLVEAVHSGITEENDAMVAVRPVLDLPPGRSVEFVWGRSIETPDGVATGLARDTVHEYRVREPFTANLACRRLADGTSCDPLGDIRLVFSEDVPADAAMASRLAGPGGARLTPRQPDRTAWIRTLTFPGPMAVDATYSAELPHDLRDVSGRPLERPEIATLETGALPPLARFAADFGIIEASEPVLPLTLRNLGPDLEDRVTLTGVQVRISTNDDDTGRYRDIVEALQTVAGRGTGVRSHLSSAIDTLPVATAKSEFAIPTSHTGKNETEVVGVPLSGSGLHVVEVASEILADAYLYGPRPDNGEWPDRMTVASTVLVTDLAVHLKIGPADGLVWVTGLDEGVPRSGVDITVTDCTGDRLWSGVTAGDGTSVLPGELLDAADRNCDERGWSRYASGLFVFAEHDDDLGFVHSSWNRGLEPWRFGLTQTHDGDANRPLAHTVFDRTLLRAGEELGMRHVLREATAHRFEISGTSDRYDTLEIRHTASGQSYMRSLDWEADGTALTSWRIPEAARIGEYRVYFKEDTDQPVWQALAAGDFRVQAFQVPILKGNLALPGFRLRGRDAIPVTVQVAWFGGGPAAGLPVTLRVQKTTATTLPAPEAFRNLSFGRGLARDAEDAGSGRLFEAEAVLDDAGSATIEVPAPDADGGARRLLFEAEYRDPNGEIRTIAADAVWQPAPVALGIDVQASVMEAGEPAGVDVAAIDTDGHPIVGQEVGVAVSERRFVSHRKKLVGGVYDYEHDVVFEAIGELCRGETDAKGRLTCEVVLPRAGHLVFEARSPDEALATHTMRWVHGEGRAWFGIEATDRIDLVPEHDRYEPGDTARIRVEMPFESAHALVTVEREGVLSHRVVALDASDPTVTIPIEDDFAPNVFASVLVLRGRVAEPPPTGVIDLGKPAYRYGLTKLDVGWSRHTLDVQVKPDATVYEPRQRVRGEVRIDAPSGQELDEDASIVLAVVDEALLELTPNDSWNLLGAMMTERPISVMSATAQMEVVGKRHYGLKAVPAGGGGGVDPVRELFDTRVHWQGRVPLDADGVARFDFVLNDSLTRFRIVAVALSGPNLFGTGSATIRSTTDLLVAGALPPLVREGDRFVAGFTLRNAGDRVVRLTARLEETKRDYADFEPRNVVLEPGRSADVSWPVDVPDAVTALEWLLTVSEEDRVHDRLAMSQEVAPAVPATVQQATLLRPKPSATLEIARPSSALPGRGGIEVSPRRSLPGAGLDGVIDWMSAYPYSCLEQRISRAATLDRAADWDGLMAELPAYLDDYGLARYFPTSQRGSAVLTAYLLRLSDMQGWSIPSDTGRRMLGALDSYLATGRDDHPGDTAAVRLSVIEALSRHGVAKPEMLDAVPGEPTVWSTTALLDWFEILARSDTPEADRALDVLHTRLRRDGPSLRVAATDSPETGWLMRAPETTAVRLLNAALEHDQLAPDADALLDGAVAMQNDGHWQLTTTNAMGAAALRRFADTRESEAVTGETVVWLGDDAARSIWTSDTPAPIRFPWRDDDSTDTLVVEHDGSGAPWIRVESRAAVPVERAVSAGIGLRKSIEPVQRRTPGEWSVGDLVRVQLELEVPAPLNWVVVSDPIPAGATVLGRGLAGEGRIARTDEGRRGLWPAFQERRYGRMDTYYEYVPAGTWPLEFTYRLNTAGRFALPPTRAEALYAPWIFGLWPNVEPVSVVD